MSTNYITCKHRDPEYRGTYSKPLGLPSKYTESKGGKHVHNMIETIPYKRAVNIQSTAIGYMLYNIMYNKL